MTNKPKQLVNEILSKLTFKTGLLYNANGHSCYIISEGTWYIYIYMCVCVCVCVCVCARVSTQKT